MNQNEEIDFNDGHYIELLDRTHIAASYLQMSLGEHPVLLKHPDLNNLYNQSIEALEELYQAIGKIPETWK